MKIGWIGVGIMGRPMCAHLLNAKHDVTVYSRSPQKAEELVGAKLAGSAGQATAGAEAVFSIVGYPMDVEELYFGKEGIIATADTGCVLVDMTTSSPELAVRIAEQARSRGLMALDAPVSGGDVGAREAKLAIMVGGEQKAFDRIRPLFELMGKTIALMGPPGSGQHSKMANQIAIASTMIGVVESLLYARSANLNLHALIDIIGTGAAASWSLNNLGRRIANGDFNPGFMIHHFVKDMGIALAEAKRMKLNLNGLSLAESFYQRALERGLADRGTQALFQVLDDLVPREGHK
ncbi:MAG: oxidoreductase [Spirochaeta sp. LUC14_002_19_P3]|nr:MAG: oxidoreductase [Spirochaeta sp. LUC14_002_19_P3]